MAIGFLQDPNYKIFTWKDIRISLTFSVDSTYNSNNVPRYVKAKMMRSLFLQLKSQVLSSLSSFMHENI